MWYYWSNPCRIMFLMPLLFWAMGPNSLLCLDVSEVLEILFPNSLWRQRSRTDWTLTETCWDPVAEFLGQSVEMSVEFFPG